jgi:trans-2,3-dihydro-3-hydroxyanthranilate isomerase
MGLHFDIVDVFTDRPYAGNPLAVVHRARTLTARQMQAIAAEFGFSETAFPLPPTTSRATTAADLHPARELPFAGPPEHRRGLGAGFADMIRIGDVVQECGAGLLPVHVDGTGRAVRRTPVVGPDLDGARSRRGRPRRGRPRPGPAAGRRVGRRAVRVPAGAPGRGGPGGARTRPRSRGPRRSDRVAVVAVDREKAQAHLRMFAPAGRGPEDPATGLGGGGARRVPRRARGAARRADGAPIAQGAEIGRPVDAWRCWCDVGRSRGRDRGRGGGAGGGQGELLRCRP